MAKLIKGETLKLEFSVTADSVEVIVAGATKIISNAILEGGVFKFIHDTSNMPTGLYSWEAFMITGDEKKHITRDTFELKESLASAPSTAYDAERDKSDARIMVEMIEKMLKGNASAGVKSYQINNRSLERYSIPELLQLLNYYKNQLSREVRSSKGMSGLGPRIEFRT